MDNTNIAKADKISTPLAAKHMDIIHIVNKYNINIKHIQGSKNLAGLLTRGMDSGTPRRLKILQDLL